MMMNNKNDILESWIMVEHLSEGDINLNNKAIMTFNRLWQQDYYAALLDEMNKSGVGKYKNSGIVIYFDIFPFREVIDYLREKYKLKPTEQEIALGNKFSFALYFDKELNFISEMTFLTESYYIRNKRRIPKENEFMEFEVEKRKEFEELFECLEDVNYITHFNSMISLILKKNNILIENCRMQALKNIETDATNLHSFFITDLEKAKKIHSGNLDKYIVANSIERINLDSRKESKEFNPEIFYDILQPKNYPIARFPSNPQFSLAFMQQVAVNLSIGFDNNQIRSVNGPPGTGKTTLLKDIFAELIVEQSYEIAKNSLKYITGNDSTKYMDNAAIGIMPKNVAEKCIVVASSNHSAIQNIVNELPLSKKIDKEFIDSIVSADYFKEIANSLVETEWYEDEKGKHERLKITLKEDTDKFWGLFSIEGGKKDNMKYIVTVLKHIENYLKCEYTPDDDVYKNFLEMYDNVCNYRSNVQNISQDIKNIKKSKSVIDDKLQKLNCELTDRKDNLRQLKLENEKFIEDNQYKIENLENEMNNFNTQMQVIEYEKSSILKCIEALKLQKPRWFSRRKHKKEYRRQSKEYSDQLQMAIANESKIGIELLGLQGQIKDFQEKIDKIKRKSEQDQITFYIWEKNKKSEIRNLKVESENLGKRLNSIEINELNLDLNYEELQLSNPWFDINYRRLQSQLFIKALEVRKQFLYENIKNIKAAYTIWNKQSEYLEKKHIISEAWNWINMTIPVIGSTFASFSRMCANMGKETIGHLFIDEAGQALPQASVGAIFRSKYVMAVGDPAQIKPVLTLDSNILNMLGEYYGVSKQYLSETTSTQTLVDAISQYGFYKDNNKEDWIGIPLWVHRRCKYPMFDISNKISYSGNMVQGEDAHGISEWYDIKGRAVDKYVAEQGDFLREKLKNMIMENPDIVNKQKEDIVYVISPFKNVAYQLSQELKKIGFTRYDKNGKVTNIGTVHTFQGKEAPIVFLVLGADEKCIGAANWAMGTENPNIMNVAATRAKDEFYIIGDKKMYLSLNSDVINDTYEIIKKHMLL